MEDYLPEISATLKLGKIKSSTQTLLETAESCMIMGTFFIIVHPELYHTGHKVFFEIINNPSIMKEGEAVLQVLKYWTSPLLQNAIDFLTTIGQYSGGWLIIHNLGLEFQYESGTGSSAGLVT